MADLMTDLRETFFVNLAKGHKKRNIIALLYKKAQSRLPHVNASDIWHHYVYPNYLNWWKGSNANQSWVRVSGEAFELLMPHIFNPVLKQHNIELVPLISKDRKIVTLKEMGIYHLVGGSKIDIAIRKEGKVRGGLHCKVSLAERVSDDIPASRRMMENNFLSILMTMDVKSHPSNPVNYGELGSPDRPTDKRKYIEDHGDFDACFSFNERTIPSPEVTISGKRIYVDKFKATDSHFVNFLVERIK